MLSSKWARTRSSNVVMGLSCDVLQPDGTGVSFDQHRVEAAAAPVRVFLQVVLDAFLQPSQFGGRDAVCRAAERGGFAVFYFNK